MNNKKKSYKDYLRDYLICLSFAILIIVIFCIYFYNVFVKFQIKYMQQYNKTVISKTYDFQNDLIIVSNSFFKERNTNVFLNGNDIGYDTEVTKNITSLLNSSTISPMFKDVVIRTPRNNLVYSTLTNKREPLEELTSKYPELTDISNSVQSGFEICYYNDTIIYAYNDYLGHIIYAFVDERNLKNHLLNSAPPISYDTLILEKEKLITANTAKDNDTIYKEIETNESDSVGFKDGKIVVKTTSGKHTGISTVKISAILKEATQTSSFLILFAILIFLLVSFITYYFYFKQKKFISAHLSLVKDNIDANIEHIINKIFNYDVLTPSVETTLNEYFQTNDGNYFMPLVIKITNYAELAENSSYSDVTVYKYGFVNIITEVLEEISGVKTSNIGRENIGVLLYNETPFDIKTIKTKTEYFENVIQKHFQATLFTVIGKEVEDTISVYEQIPSLINAQNYKFINNENKVLISEIGLEEQNVEYPFHIQTAIIAAINAKNNESLTDGINQFADYIIKGNALSGKEWFLKLFLAISDDCQKNAGATVSHNTLEAMFKCEKIDEIAELLSNSIKYVNTNATQTNAEVSENFDKIVKKAIEEEYSNPDFCIQSITERFGFTASYFGKKFKHNFDVSFNKYLLDYRLNKAIELLLKTDYTNTKISQMCGFNSETYFMTIFKKNLGLSPKAYKSTYLNKNKQ